VEERGATKKETYNKMELEFCRIEKHNNGRRVATAEREREISLTANHSCHLTSVPFGHVLIEHRCGIKHCKRGCNKENERPTHQPTNNKSYRFKTQNQNNKTCENCDLMKLELSYIKLHNN